MNQTTNQQTTTTPHNTPTTRTTSHFVEDLGGGGALNLYERRSLILKKQAEGYDDTSLVKDMECQYGVSKTNTWHDLRTIQQWAPRFQDANMIDLKVKLLARGEYLYREASFQYRMCSNDCVKQGWFSRMQSAHHDLCVLINPEFNEQGIGNIRQMVVTFGYNPNQIESKTAEETPVEQT